MHVEVVLQVGLSPPPTGASPAPRRASDSSHRRQLTRIVPSNLRWPVIAAIISAGLVSIVIVWCLVGCICFGTRCCCGCCGCCRGRRRRRRRGAAGDEPKGLGPQAPPSPMPPPAYNNWPLGHAAAYRGRRPSSPAVPQHPPSQSHATNPDALQPMPTWQAAQERRIYDERRHAGADVELDQFHPSPPITPVLGQHPQQYPHPGVIGSTSSPSSSTTYPAGPPSYDPNPYAHNRGAPPVPSSAPAGHGVGHHPLQYRHQQHPQQPTATASPTANASHTSPVNHGHPRKDYDYRIGGAGGGYYTDTHAGSHGAGGDMSGGGGGE